MNGLLSLFHRHEFAKDSWKLVSEVETEEDVTNYWELERHYVPTGKTFMFSNTCVDCGYLVFRRVRDL